MYDPISTYRVQLHKNFTLRDLEGILPYLRSLGIRTIYASPIFEAVPGSTHGYDVLNPERINPEIGTEADFISVTSKARQAGMGWLQDIVPNHMAFDPRNPWIYDLLEKGVLSPYAKFFDWDRESPVHEGRLMVPFLGESLEDAVHSGALKLAAEGGWLHFRYYDTAYPLHPRSYEHLLRTISDPSEAVTSLMHALQDLQAAEDPAVFGAQWHEWGQQLGGLSKNESFAKAWQSAVERINADSEALLQMAVAQAYSLCHWQETERQINYRRFFTVNSLICLNIHEEAVFEKHHRYVLELVRKGHIQGLRIDHIDGLYDPSAYLQRLREKLGDGVPVYVEKILEEGEALPAFWPVEGSTGYDFLATVNNLQTHIRGEAAFTQYYYDLVQDHRFVPQQVRDKKSLILYHHMGGELDNLFRLLMGLLEEGDYGHMRTEDLRTVLAEVLVHCPVYRYYANLLPLEGGEALAIQKVIEAVKASRPDLAAAADLLFSIWTDKAASKGEAYQVAATHFYKRCMQFSGPLMAKGVEDTLMYTFNRFIGHNEVGDAPGAFGLGIPDFHEAMKARGQWPLSLNGTATHDTKRGEDVRARLNVLTEIPEEWLSLVTQWREMNSALKSNGAPDANDEYFIYQTLVGTYPVLREEEGDYPARLTAYLQKAFREAKRHTHWSQPDAAYEKAVESFALALLDPGQPFWTSFAAFLQRIMDFGTVNSLVQLVLKSTCPGVPDIYQGCELWDLSFVDPDNRRPVDYSVREDLLRSFSSRPDKAFLETLWKNRHAALPKLWLSQFLLNLRSRHPALFSKGDYLSLEVKGRYRDHVLTFARRSGSTWVGVIVPLHLASLCQSADCSPGTLDWEDTEVVPPPGAAPSWTALLPGSGAGNLRLSALFGPLPLAIVEGRMVEGERSSGVLLHITSLPGPYGTGNMGAEAFHFADLLAQARQKYWQILPLNPTGGGQGYSPYSATSAMAGNPLLIAPRVLMDEGLLEASDLEGQEVPQGGKADFAAAEGAMNLLLDKAFRAFVEKKNEAMAEAFRAFRASQPWLKDFALYTVIKEAEGGRPWYEWPDALKRREPTALSGFAAAHAAAIEKACWIQWVFDRQWKALKAHCNGLGIRIVGDLPFYVSYDAADVWAHQDLFSLDADGAPTAVAGVPPDAFSAEGQLWGMPVFRWEVLRASGYEWWIERLRKNRELFDLVRLDHFRAFESYWEVPAGAPTACGGTWVKGPGAAFFEAVREALGELPFVAEDLGAITDEVLALRDAFGLPGMKVLQFAFDENMSRSAYIPHHFTPPFFAYTGTHDNPTTRGWFEAADAATRQRLSDYLGRPIDASGVSDALCRLAFSSVAHTVIMPLQDILGLGAEARMNLPASAENNWSWRILPGQFTREAVSKLRTWTALYHRD